MSASHLCNRVAQPVETHFVFTLKVTYEVGNAPDCRRRVLFVPHQFTAMQRHTGLEFLAGKLVCRWNKYGVIYLRSEVC